MPEPTLLLGAGLDLLSFVLYARVGQLVSRAIRRDEAHARDGFAIFWHGVALVNLLQAILILMAVAGRASDGIAEAFWQARIALALGSFGGIVYYLLYIWTGSRRWLFPTALFYITTFLLMMAWMAQSGSPSMKLDAWRVNLDYPTQSEGALYRTVVLMFFLPPALAAASYALVLRHTKEPQRRRRVALVSVSLGAYFTGLLIGYLDTDFAHWGLVENLIGIAAAVIVMHALATTAEERA